MVILKGKSSRVPRALISGALAAALLTTNVQAAVLGNVAGPVLVNHGGGFFPASAGSSLVPGDRVRVELSPYDLTKGRITFRERSCATALPRVEAPLAWSLDRARMQAASVPRGGGRRESQLSRRL